MPNTQFPDLPPQVRGDLIQVFKLLSDKTRFQILIDLSRHGEFNVMELCQRLGQTQPAVSHHLGLLRLTGIIKMRRDGKSHYYSVAKERFADIIRQFIQHTDSADGNIEFEDYRLVRSSAN